jgi:hypothetical protein
MIKVKQSTHRQRPSSTNARDPSPSKHHFHILCSRAESATE